jgi:hypothetical protein
MIWDHCCRFLAFGPTRLESKREIEYNSEKQTLACGRGNFACCVIYRSMSGLDGPNACKSTTMAPHHPDDLVILPDTFPTMANGPSPLGSIPSTNGNSLHWSTPNGYSALENAHSPVGTPHWGVFTLQWGLPTGECYTPHWECTLPIGDSPLGEWGAIPMGTPHWGVYALNGDSPLGIGELTQCGLPTGECTLLSEDSSNGGVHWGCRDSWEFGV